MGDGTVGRVMIVLAELLSVEACDIPIHKFLLSCMELYM